MRYTQHFNTKVTPQTQPIPGSNQVKMRSGGYGWEVSDKVLLDRFLIAGTEGGSYYASEKDLTIQAGENVMRMIDTDGVAVVDRIVEISDAGRAPKNDAALFALAIAASAKDEATRKAAFAALPKVARTGTHLFQFADAVTSFRDWGRGLRSAIAKWYSEKEDNQLAYQLIKYKQRNGWSNRDLIRLSHVKPDSDTRIAMYRWAVGKDFDIEMLPEVMKVHDKMHADGTKVEDVLAMLNDHPKYPWEGIPTEHLNDKRVWEAMLPGMPPQATIRNLGKMTSIGVLAPMSDYVDIVVQKLTNQELIRSQRVHPINTLFALDTYKSGHGKKGSLTWNPVAQIIDALDEAFYLGFAGVEPTNKRWMIAVDVSGSMDWKNVKDTNMTPRVLAGALAMVPVRTEPKYMVTAFSDHIVEVPLSKKMRLDAVLKTFDDIEMGGTDAALPILYALEKQIPIDVFVAYSDNEAWSGTMHVNQALQQYRNEMGIQSKLICMAMTPDRFSVADPSDPLQVNMVGVDASAPEFMAAFVKAGD